MKNVNAKQMSNWEYLQQRNQERKEQRALRDQKKQRKVQWTNIVGYD